MIKWILGKISQRPRTSNSINVDGRQVHWVPSTMKIADRRKRRVKSGNVADNDRKVRNRFFFRQRLENVLTGALQYSMGSDLDQVMDWLLPAMAVIQFLGGIGR